MSDLPTSNQQLRIALQAMVEYADDLHGPNACDCDPSVGMSECSVCKARNALLPPDETDGHQRCEVQLLGTRCWREVDHTDTHRARVNGEWLDWMGSDEDRPAVEPSGQDTGIEPCKCDTPEAKRACDRDCDGHVSVIPEPENCPAIDGPCRYVNGICIHCRSPEKASDEQLYRLRPLCICDNALTNQNPACPVHGEQKAPKP